MAAPLNPVESSNFTPLSYGLWSVVQDRSASDDRWRAGVWWQPICGTADTTYEKCLTVTGTGGVAPPPPGKEATHTIAARGAQPFTVFAEIDCSPVGFVNDPFERTNAQNAAKVALSQTEMIQVERAFWTGIAGNQAVVFPHLAENTEFIAGGPGGVIMQTAASTAVTGSVLDVVEALGYLESSLDACYGGQGVIHVPDILFNALVAQHLVVQVGGPNGPRLQTVRGNLIAVGAGYPGTAPDGTQPVNAVWMYATGAVFGYRGMEPAPDGNMSAAYNVRDWLDRANNTMKVQAERTYLIGWDCCHFAVQVSLGGIVTGQPLTAF